MNTETETLATATEKQTKKTNQAGLVRCRGDRARSRMYQGLMEIHTANAIYVYFERSEKKHEVRTPQSNKALCISCRASRMPLTPYRGLLRSLFTSSLGPNSKKAS